MIEELKQAIRITHDKLDDDLKSNVDACILDLKRVGVTIPSADGDIYGFAGDSLEKKAIELYVKWQYNYCGKGEQYRQNYESLRDSLSLSGNYNGKDGDKDV